MTVVTAIVKLFFAFCKKNAKKFNQTHQNNRRLYFTLAARQALHTFTSQPGDTVTGDSGDSNCQTVFLHFVKKMQKNLTQHIKTTEGCTSRLPKASSSHLHTFTSQPGDTVTGDSGDTDCQSNFLRFTKKMQKKLTQHRK